MATINTPSTSKVEDKEVTVENISTKQLLRLVWMHLGSPYGSPEEWVKRNQESVTTEG